MASCNLLELNKLESSYQSLGQNQEALKYDQDALKMFEALYSNSFDHPDIQMARKNIAKLEEELQKRSKINE